MVAFYPEQLCLPAIASGMPKFDQIHTCSALTLLKALPDGCIDCVVTSPPYYALRSYLDETDPNKPLEIGLEATPQLFIERLMQLFREVHRVLKPSGTVWVNLGDSYVGATSNHGAGGSQGHNSVISKKTMSGIPQDNRRAERNRALYAAGLPMKSLMMIPARFAIAMQDEGWILRSDIIWHKPAPMPEPVLDRPTKAHEYVYLFAKEPRYWYDANAVAEPYARDYKDGPGFGGFANRASQKYSAIGNFAIGENTRVRDDGCRNLRSVWTIPSEPFTDAHFAVMPSKLVETCIKAGCPPHGIVLDPFMGSGTTAITARRLGRHYIGSDLNPEYVQMARKRLAQTDPYQHKQVGSMKQLSMFAAAQP